MTPVDATSGAVVALGTPSEHNDASAVATTEHVLFRNHKAVATFHAPATMDRGAASAHVRKHLACTFVSNVVAGLATEVAGVVYTADASDGTTQQVPLLHLHRFIDVYKGFGTGNRGAVKTLGERHAAVVARGRAAKHDGHKKFDRMSTKTAFHNTLEDRVRCMCVCWCVAMHPWCGMWSCVCSVWCVACGMWYMARVCACACVCGVCKGCVVSGMRCAGVVRGLSYTTVVVIAHSPTVAMVAVAAPRHVHPHMHVHNDTGGDPDGTDAT